MAFLCSKRQFGVVVVVLNGSLTNSLVRFTLDEDEDYSTQHNSFRDKLDSCE